MTATLGEVPGQQAIGLPCHLVDPEVFFADSPTDIAYAKALCTDCPLKGECLDGALVRNEAAGIWGGELLINGKIVAHKRPRGRPRKDPTDPESTPAVVRRGRHAA